MSTQFLNGENVCGETLLKIVSKGSAILAELQRLGGCIPKCYLTTNDPKYQKVIPDFNYFKNIDVWEKQIQDNMELLALDENIKVTYLPLIQRFYILFESIYLYYSDLCEFVNQLDRGVFIQYTVDNILENQQGKQLMAEGFYQYGVMLFLMDHVIPGITREKMLVSIYRNKGGDNIDNINYVRRLCTDTEFRAATKNTPTVKPQNYPVDLFQRFEVDAQVVEKIIVSIKDDDIYGQAAAYPAPALRSFALANQSAIIFILLFFVPKALDKSKSSMREIVDKHFYNTWVLPYYLGYIVDLTFWWAPYKAAKMALGNILDIESIQDLTKQFVTKQQQCYQKCKQYLIDGVMTEQFVLNKLNTLMNCVRDSNVTIRWLMLHRKTSHQKLRQIIFSKTNPTRILKLLLVCSQFENKLKQQCEALIARKQQIWDQDRNNSKQRMSELSEYFGGARALGKIQTDDSFRDWFKNMAEEIQKLTYNDSTYAGRKIQRLLKAMQDVEQYHQISSNIQIKQYLHDTRGDLKHMVKVVNMKKSIGTHIQIITDITWSWIALKDYINLMQAQVKKNPSVALLLKNTFTKLSSILNTPMVRVVQANSPDMASVSKYYSNQLMKLVKDVLQIIPGSVFDSLQGLIDLLTHQLKIYPQKFDKAQLSQYSQFKQRKEMAKLTNEIAVFAESILTMQSYLVGVIEVNPRQILEDGIKKQLIKLIAKILDQQLVFKAGTIEEFQLRLKLLGDKMDGLKISLQYVQDFIRTYGLKVYYQEFERLMECYIDMEKVSMMTHKVGFQEVNYDEDIPMPSGNDTNCNNFMGRLLFQIINLTDYRKCIFLYSTYAFYQLNTGKEVFTLKTLANLYKCIGVSGLQGLDHLLGVQIMINMRSIFNHLSKDFDEGTKKVLISSFKTLKDFNSYNEKYEHIIVNLKKSLRGLHANINVALMKIGQYIILKDLICLELQMLSKVGSNRLYLVLDNVNKTIKNDIVNREYTQDMMSDANIQAENSLLSLISKYCNYLGMSQPLRKIYITVKPIMFLPLIMFVMVSINIPNVDYDKKLQSLIRKNPKEPFQPLYFTTGMLAFLNQFHPANKQIFYSYIGHYIRSSMNYIMLNKEVAKNPELITDLFTYIMFFEEMSKVSKQPYGKLKEVLDVGLLSQLNKNTLKSATSLG